MIPSRVNPISLKPGTVTDTNAQLVRPVQSISMGVRIGTHDVNIGYIQKFNWSISRPSSDVYQIEPCVNGTFGGLMNELVDSKLTFSESVYFPGEVIEVIPGKQGAASLDISRAVLYGSNLLSALMYIEDAGTEATTVATSEKGLLSFGGGLMQYVTLIQQVRPFYLKQVIYNPADGKISWGREFQEVWIEEWSEEIPDASKNEVIIDSMKAKAARIRPYTAGTKYVEPTPVTGTAEPI